MLTWITGQMVLNSALAKQITVYITDPVHLQISVTADGERLPETTAIQTSSLSTGSARVPLCCYGGFGYWLLKG